MRNKMISLLFVVYILVFAIGTILVRDRDFSEMENRNLAQMPVISAKSVLDGSFSSDFEKYMSDQIMGKDMLVRLKVLENRALGQKCINGVYFAADDMLIADYINPYNQLSKNLNYINEFVENNPELDCTWLLAPNACYIYDDKLPAFASCYDQGEVMAYIEANAVENMRVVDCSRELMADRDSYIYYRTDHHWTMHGAYIGYSVLCDALGIDAVPEDRYDIRTGSSTFLGTQYSNAPMFAQKPDDILLYYNPQGNYEVEYVDDGVTMNSLYNTDNLKIKDKYTTYLDGNHSYVKIKSNSSNDEKLLVVKDSYAHSLLPLLADNYSEIHVVDLRYYHQSVSALAEAEGITQVVFINNLDFISTDDNYLWLQ